MRHKVQQAIQKFRLENPQTSGWENEEVLEAMFLIASQQDESGIRVIGRDASGRLIFRITRGADVPDAL
jgi:hypothetical protein